LFVNFGETEENYILSIVSQLRQTGISVEFYPNADKFNKQMAYAMANRIPYLVKIEEADRLANQARIKNLISGEQFTVTVEDLSKWQNF
ncbi:MAG: histidine--tRNA ligase, partial [Candidatus Symbiothrix sp.]|nr:histidine--tRNA ligase [Candidatus Symbiothrix sp.]